MKVDEMLDALVSHKFARSYGIDSEYGTILSIEEAGAISAKLRAAEELAAVVEDLYTEARPVHMETLFGPALELRLGNRLHDYRKAGTEEVTT